MNDWSESLFESPFPCLPLDDDGGVSGFFFTSVDDEDDGLAPFFVDVDLDVPLRSSFSDIVDSRLVNVRRGVSCVTISGSHQS